MTASKDLPPGTKVRWTEAPSHGHPAVATLVRRKTIEESPHLPGWWCETGGLADMVLDYPHSAWEVVPPESGPEAQVLDITALLREGGWDGTDVVAGVRGLISHAENLRVLLERGDPQCPLSPVGRR